MNFTLRSLSCVRQVEMATRQPFQTVNTFKIFILVFTLMCLAGSEPQDLDCNTEDCEALVTLDENSSTALPDSIEEIDTKFLLYSKNSNGDPIEFNYSELGNLGQNAAFNSSRPNKLIIHGFRSACNKKWVEEIVATLLNVSDVNVICVDWRKIADRRNYIQAASNVEVVGKQVADLVNNLRRNFGDGLNFHLIGFSLGAHVAGITGREVRNIDRISGLDPAGPLFASHPPDVRLDKSDAKFVDVIHTSGNGLSRGGLGTLISMGHIDFYPNGGRVQPSCPNRSVWGVLTAMFRQKHKEGRFCNHKRAYKLYIASMKPNCTFKAYECSDYEKFQRGECFSEASAQTMGYFANANATGSVEGDEPSKRYFLETFEEAPYCANYVAVRADLIYHSKGRIEASVRYSGIQSKSSSLLSHDDSGLVQSRLLLIPQTNSTDVEHSITFEFIPKSRRFWRQQASAVLLRSVSVNFLELNQSWKSCDSSLQLEKGYPVTLSLHNETCYQKT